MNHVPERIPDHSILLCTIDVPRDTLSESNTPVNKQHRTKYDVWRIEADFMNNENIHQQILDTIERIEYEITTNENIQSAYNDFERLLKEEMENRLPKITLNRKDNSKRKSRYKPYWNEILQEQWDKVKVTERAWTKFQGSRITKRRLKEEFCAERRVFDKLNRKYKRQHRDGEQRNLEDKLNGTNKSDFWKTIGRIGMANERNKGIPCEIVDDNGNVVTDKRVVIEKWKTEMEKLYNPSGDTENYDIPDLDEPLFDANILNEPITIEEVLMAVSHLKNNKATGFDQIPSEVLKNEATVYILHKICNGCFDIGKVPDQWTLGIINPIYKQGSDDERNPLNYRGITLSSVPGKVYCTVLNNRVSEWLEEHDVLCDEQNGFRKNPSCEEHILSLYTLVNERKISRQSTYACFIEMKKAFDTVNRGFLLYKLQRIGVRGKVVKAIGSLYENVRCSVRVNDDHTPWFDVTSGVNRGACFRPQCFLYT